MPNPHVVRVDRDAFWNQYRSTPEPALMMRRPPQIVEEPLFTGRWPSTGPYAGQSFAPFAYGAQAPLTPIQLPIPEDLPTAPSDVDIAGLAAPMGYEPGAWMLLPAIASSISAFHGYKRNHESVGWAVAWGFAGWLLWPVVPVIAFAQGYAVDADDVGFSPETRAAFAMEKREFQRRKMYGSKKLRREY